MSWFSRRDEPDEWDLPKPPEAVDHDEFREDLEREVEKLLPDAVDEVTPHVLDRLINRYTQIQQQRVIKAWAIYENALLPHFVEARGEVAYQGVMWEAQRRYLDELRIARDAAVSALAGPDAAATPAPPQMPQLGAKE